MARFPTPQQIVDAFRAEGLTVVEMPGWRGRCRCCTGPHNPHAANYVRPWITFHGVTWHSTYGARLSGQAAIDYTNRILIAGNGHVPGPLCLAGVDANGRMLMVAAGRANHVGRIGTAALAAMRNASFSLAGNQNLRGSGVDGNAYTLGFEALGSGSPNPAQIDAMVRGSAALCRITGWSGQETHGHGEVSVDRSFSDPGNDMGAARRSIMARLTVKKPPAPPAAPAPTAPPKPAPAPLEDPVPDSVERNHRYDHDGRGWQYCPKPIFEPRPHPTKYATGVIVTGPEGSKVRARLAAIHNGTNWFRYPAVNGTGNVAHLSLDLWTHAPGIPVHVDVESDTPGAVHVFMTTHIWKA